MGLDSHEAINQFKKLMDQVEEPLKRTFKNVHQGHVIETLERFLKAREWNVSKAYKMLVDSLQWRLQNEIDDILAKPIIPANFYRGVRDSQLIGLSGYTKEGLPVFAIGAGLSTFDKASVHYYVQSHIQINEYRDRVILPEATKRHGKYIGKCVKVLDMNGLKLSALNQLKLLQTISTVDDLNYPEKTITYYIVNVPYIFSACWKVVKPLLQERTKLKIRVLQGSGRDELLKIMDYSSLPHFCRRDESGSGSGSVLRSWSGSWSWSGSGSGAGAGSGSVSSTSSDDDCFSLDHPFHQELYSYMKQQSAVHEPLEPAKQGSVHVEVPLDNHENADFHSTLESELNKLRIQNTRSGSLEKVNASD
ncbi:putative CRAL-TRIO lipid binding domain, CRAL/TRIO domain, CRAL/TRIO domain superfamily [Helianthus debilis subsp. tardiflorus]